DPAGANGHDPGLGACRARGEGQNAQHHAGSENLENCATTVFHGVSPGKRPSYHVLWPRIPVGNRSGKDPAHGAESRSAAGGIAPFSTNGQAVCATRRGGWLTSASTLSWSVGLMRCS